MSDQTRLPLDKREDYRQRALAHLWVHTRQWNELAEQDGLKVFVDGSGARLVDAEGNSYIDALSGLWVVNVGHGRREIAAAAYEQMKQLVYVNTFAHASLPPIDLATKLAELTPGSLSKVFFVNSGSEAVETALKMAKQYHYLAGQQKRYKVIARRHSYHGTTLGALSVNGSRAVYRPYFEPLVPGAIHVPNVNCYRCDYGLSPANCDVLCAKMVEQTIQFEGPDTVAALIAEPISTAAGTHIPPRDYWKILRDICDRYGVLLVADEVINGFGRTGKWFGSQHFGLVPDIMTLAKGLSSGYLPIAATVARKEVAERFKGGRKEAFAHGITFGGHPAAAAAALKNIEIIESEQLVENSAEMGAYLLNSLEALRGHEIVGDVRGLGLMCALELVKDKKTKERFAESDDIGARLTRSLSKRGLLTRAGEIVQLAPPLCVVRQDIDEIVRIVDESLAELESELLVRPPK
ncbi:MAG: aspartate aminotransferase family protein [Chloroflexi bacterium]|nr:aspartate aminotransferase family protein [Chloroflexota bacterium]